MLLLSRKLYCFILVLFAVTLFFLLPNKLSPNMNVDESSPQMLVSASNGLSSYNPIAYQSNSGRTHLFFLHDKDNCDFMSFVSYHTYELDDGKWSIPRRTSFSTKYILAINPSENGFNIIYFTAFPEIRTVEFDEQANEWLKSKRVFGTQEVRTIMNKPDKAEIDWNPNSILVEDEVVFVCWNYGSSNMVTKITASSNSTQKIRGLEFSYGPFQFVRGENSLFLYSIGYRFETGGFNYRAELFSNGTWSKWQPTGFEIELWGGYSWNGEYIIERDPFVVEGKYLVGQRSFEKLFIVDLTRQNLTAHTQMINFTRLNLSGSDLYDVELVKDSIDETLFNIVTTEEVTTKQLRLNFWTFNYDNGNLSHSSALNYTIPIRWSGMYDLSIDFLLDGLKRRVFWNQVEVGNYEIFTTTYDPVTNEWTPALQVTDTNTILDDSCNFPHPSQIGFIALLLFGGILALVLLIFISGTKRK